jgi:hypothetical protein
MRTFITFAAGETYEKLAEVLKESIETFSQYPLIIYKPEDFEIDYNPELWNGPSSINFSYKKSSFSSIVVMSSGNPKKSN